jgi:hypothetical protein
MTTLNRVAIILNEHGEFDGVVADSPIEFFVVQPSCKHDRVYHYDSGDYGPQHVQAAFSGNPVGHAGDGTFDNGLNPTISGKLAPSKPHIKLVD